MGRMFSRLRNIFERKALVTEPATGLTDLFGGTPTQAGVTITPESAMHTPAVFAAIRVLAESIAQLPIETYRRTADGGRERADDTRLHELLRYQPNGWTTAYEFKQSMMTDLLLRGNAFAFVNRNGNNQIVELIQLPAHAVTITVDTFTLEPTYTIALDDGDQRTLDRRDILHLKTAGPDHYQGLSPIQANREAIALVMSMERHAAGLFGSGARPSGVLESSKPLTGDAMRRVRESFSKVFGGPENSGKTPVLENGMQFKPITFSSADAQFLEMRRFQMAEVARIFRIPLHLMQELERTTHANAESLGQQFLTFTLLPYIHNFEGGFRRTLLTPEQRRELFIEFRVDDLTRANISERFAAYSKAIETGILNPNEARAEENRAPYTGGDQFRRPMNTEVPDGN